MSSRSNRLIAITGGIGSGKSVISRLLRVMGYRVYDCDDRAKWVMTHDSQLRAELIELFGTDTYHHSPEGEWVLNRPYLSARIFADGNALQRMNACVHPAVARDLEKWCEESIEQEAPLFFESAILYESHFDHLSHPDEVWTVSAPLEVRISRAMHRDGVSRDKVLDRISAQMPQDEKELRADHTIVNDDCQSVIAQTTSLLRHLH